MGSLHSRRAFHEREVFSTSCAIAWFETGFHEKPKNHFLLNSSPPAASNNVPEELRSKSSFSSEGRVAGDLEGDDARGFGADSITHALFKFLLAAPEGRSERSKSKVTKATLDCSAIEVLLAIKGKNAYSLLPSTFLSRFAWWRSESRDRARATRLEP